MLLQASSAGQTRPQTQTQQTRHCHWQPGISLWTSAVDRGWTVVRRELSPWLVKESPPSPSPSLSPPTQKRRCWLDGCPYHDIHTYYVYGQS